MKRINTKMLRPNLGSGRLVGEGGPISVVLEQLEISGHRGLTATDLKTLVGPRSLKPSEAALHLAGQTLGSALTRSNGCGKPTTPSFWSGPDGTFYALGGRPNDRLDHFPEFQQAVKGLTR